MSEQAFFVDLGDGRFRSTRHTVGPWDPALQHGGPPSALIGRCLERTEPRDDMRLARVSVEILGAVPVAELTVSTRLARPGKRVEMLEASVSAGGRDVLRATAWRISAEPGRATPRPHTHAAPPLPDALRSVPATFAGTDPFGYGEASEWRFASGGFAEPGPARVWSRLQVQVVDGEEPSGWQRVLAVADSGNGISGALPVQEWFFINPDLTVALHREPVGEWVCMEAETAIDGAGIGLAASDLSDETGWLGRGLQTLLIARR
ncbi:MAG TPA: thioesterase family protein [Mycobacteriales bacterium]|nr:thioesterase family protein [Mycobacteriales bacterium]